MNEISKKHYGEIQGKGKQCVGAGSLHTSGNTYDIVNNVEIANISDEDLRKIKEKFNSEEIKEKEDKNKQVGELTQEIASIVSFEELLKSYGLQQTNNNWDCPFHPSEAKQCLSINEKGIFYCFHCNRSGNIIKFVSELEGITIKEAVNKLKKMGNIDNKSIKTKKKENKEVIKEKEEDIMQKVNFNYEFSEIKINSIGELENIIIKNFPSILFEVKACLATEASLALKHLNGCPSLILVGNPSGEKTTAASFFYGHEYTYLSDDFSPRAFVSHSANVKKEDLGSIDLLPRIKNKMLITPELAPLFEAPKDRLIDNFATLTRVLDGEGLNSDKGTHGHRGYSGDYKFAWLGATTPIRTSVWQVMGKIGNRLFFLNMSDKNRNNTDYVNMFIGTPYEEKVKECRGAVRSFLDNFFKKYPIRSFEWTNISQDVFILTEITNYAILLSKLRGNLTTWQSHGEDKSDYEYTFPIIEEPPRAINALLNLARGHALIHGRNYLKSDDLELVRRVCLSSMPYDRFKFLELLMRHDGRLTTEVIQKELNCSDDNARRTMQIFKILGVVDVKSLSIGEGHPMNYVELKPEFMPLLQHTQHTNNQLNYKTQEISAVSDKSFSKHTGKKDNLTSKDDEITGVSDDSRSEERR